MSTHSHTLCYLEHKNSLFLSQTKKNIHILYFNSDSFDVGNNQKQSIEAKWKFIFIETFNRTYENISEPKRGSFISKVTRDCY